MPSPYSIANALPPLPVVLPLLFAALLAGLRSRLSRAQADSIALFAAALNTAACGALLVQSQAHTILYWFGNWYPRGSMVLGIAFVIDPVSAGLALVAAALTFLALLFSWRFVDSGSNHFQPLMLVFLAGMTGFSLTGDLFNLFVFFELMSTAAFALCGLKTREPAPLQGAFNFAVTNTIAAFLVLTGIALLYAVTGALNIAQIGLLLAHRHDSLVLFACALITCGFLTKAAIVPFHFWLADAHAVAPTPVCVLFSGIMVELGLYAVLRLHSVIFLPAIDARAPALRSIVLVFAAATVVIGALMCFAEHHIKRLLAFSTVTHSGLMLAAIAVQGPVATAGFLTYLVGHAFVKASLFFVAGILLHRLQTVSEPALFGRGKQLRVTGLLWFLGALGLASFPGFATLYGEALTSKAAEVAGVRWLPLLFVFGGMMTAAAVFRVGFHTFLGWGDGPITDQAAEVDELPETREGENKTFWYHIVPPIVCLVIAIGACASGRLMPAMLSAANRLTFQPGYLHTVYTGALVALPAVRVDVPVRDSAVRGCVAAALGLLLALSSVFRGRIARALRLGAFLEGPLPLLRGAQSGDVGDYVLWLTVGMATMASALMGALR